MLQFINYGPLEMISQAMGVSQGPYVFVYFLSQIQHLRQLGCSALRPLLLRNSLITICDENKATKGLLSLYSAAVGI